MDFYCASTLTLWIDIVSLTLTLFSYLHWTVFPCSKYSSIHSWLILWLTPAPLTHYFHWWIMALYTNWMN